MKRSKKTEQTVAERGKVYGAPIPNMRNIGKMMTGLLNQHYGINLPHDVPPDVVALIMVLVKINRSVNGIYHPDNFVDLDAYAGFAEEHQKDVQKKID